MKKNRFNGQAEKTTTTNQAPRKESANKGTKKTTLDAEYTQLQYDLADMLKAQIMHFLNVQKDIDTLSYDERRDAENALFSLPEYPTILNECPDCDAYMVNRSVRVDRETHLLTRASCTMILINHETAAPAYLVEAFINDKGGSISVIPQDNIGPVLRNTYRVSLKRD